jgi:3-hydroxyisobutyrate dehydrogenase-like beta-hydroxyacid dehydrogenase
MSTIAPEETRHFAARANASGVHLLDAPVMGSTGPAAAGTLGIMVGGDEQLFNEHRDVLSAMGKDLYYMGPQGSGAQMKLSMNLLVAAQLASLSEALVMAAKAGLNLSLAGQIIASSGVASNLISRKVNNIVQGDYTPAFSLRNMHKDLGLMVRTAEKLGVPIPTTSIIHQLYTAAKEQGYADQDSSALYCLLAELSGVGN